MIVDSIVIISNIIFDNNFTLYYNIYRINFYDLFDILVKEILLFMGLFSFFKKQLLEVIQCKDLDKDTIVSRFKLKDREEIMNSSTLIVGPAQTAIFVHKGEICDIFGPGTYKLATENIPFLTKMLSLPTGGESPIEADIYFVNMRQFTGNKWGTQNPIMMRDADFGNIRLRGFGIYSFKVQDPRLFMKEMFGQNEVYKVGEVEDQMRPMILQALSDAIAESKISALDLASHYNEFAKNVQDCAKDKFDKFGLEISTMVIENLSLPEEVEKALDERTKVGVLEDKMGTYTQYHMANAMRDAAQNDADGNMAGLGVGLGAGTAMGNLFAQHLNTKNPTAKDSGDDKVSCQKCGAQIKRDAKFCPECGQRQGVICPKCNAKLIQGAKFCTECGATLTSVCKKCGKAIPLGTKFCPECGEKVDA